MLTVEHVTKTLSGRTILRDVNLTFDRGVYGLLAPNGAGKTTLIRLLATLLFPDSGTIRLDGEDITAMGERYRARLGYLPQDFGYYPGYTPRRFLRYLAALQGLTRTRADERIDTLLDMVGLADVADRRLRTFSGGMIQRVGIAQALINDPDLLVLDEPTVGLDPRERVRFRNIIHELASTCIVILSTHIVSDLETIADRIVMLRDGTVLRDDTPAAIRAELDGRIWQVPVSTPLDAGRTLLGEVQVGGETRLRIHCAARPGLAPSDAGLPPDAVPVPPSLEDAFLLAYGD
ncbi:ABC transporter ATP-binding protein [Bifidobacterium sp. MA2]|uniref:ABC transporter ATP-binding protein n=1 Tax=Bifidobacterium santillanense TaxID=2809028 RepID=A0ABS5UPK7_9BIFI|nr:ABC transporter ATP-binding protein [Bifidobacterium santillanense]MBT1172875.1 ABC transporter ATP-binding protein [Bifidobacterium santillanense]